MASNTLSILIADDNEMNRWLLDEQMRYWTDDVVLAKDGGEAWELLQKNAYSLVFVDVNMPVLNGYELVKKVRGGCINRSVPMIAITAHVQSRFRHLLLADGFNDCLIKPIVLADLQRVISQWSAPAIDSNYYVGALLQKVEDNRELGRLFLEKLFTEVPKQLASLEQVLQTQESHRAWEFAHKLHGTFCFYGFEDFRALAQELEQSLLDADMLKAKRLLRSIATKFSDLKRMKSQLEIGFSDQSH